MKFKLLVFVILIVGAYFRFTGLNWDSHHHLHPDERFLTMVGVSLRFPDSVDAYFNTLISPANPHNQGHGFFVYGTWPLHLVKFVTEALYSGDLYDQLTVVGRFVSAAMDLSLVLLVVVVARQLTGSNQTSVWAGLVYAGLVLPIQLSHFFTVDTFMLLFAVLALSFLLQFHPASAFLAAVFFGLSVSAKVSALVFLPVFGLVFIIWFFKPSQKVASVLSGIIFLLSLAVTLRLAYPYLFLGGLVPDALNPKVLDNWRELKSYESPQSWFPPAVMWHGLSNKPLYALVNLFQWGTGWLVALFSLAGVFTALAGLRRRPHYLIVLAAFFVPLLYQLFQFNVPVRYFYPVYPFLAILAGLGIDRLRLRAPASVLFALLLLLWPLAFVSIYHRPHSRLQASDWIKQNLPPGSRLSCEYWDDCLPLGHNPQFEIIQVSPYDPESPEKWDLLNRQLAQIDYLILSSNRLYGSIPLWSQRYPQTAGFYRRLFAGELGFVKYREFSSRPNLPLPGVQLCLFPPVFLPQTTYGTLSAPDLDCSLSGLSFVDDFADENFTVYDHPKVIIFKNVSLHR